MERTKESKKDDGPKKILWIKEGGGTFRLSSGKIIKPTQKFRAFPHEIPEGFRDTVKPLEDLPPAPEEEPVEVDELEYDLKHKGGGWYDVVDSNDKVVSEQALKKDEAEALIAELKA